MNEVDFTGWTRTGAELDRIKNNPAYRMKLNRIRLVKSIQQGKGDLLYYIDCFLFNKNDF